ncbi:MAG: hypothetical protein ABIB43_04665 [archaeon]
MDKRILFLISILLLLLLMGCQTVNSNKILTDEDIIAEQEQLREINVHPNNEKINPLRYPKTLGMYDKNGLTLIEQYSCSDVCPDAGGVSIVYKDVDETKCNEIGGVVSIDPAWGGYRGCSPQILSLHYLGDCEEKTNKAQKSQCYATLGSVTSDLSLCEKADVYGTICFSEIAIKQNNESICNFIDRLEEKDYCLSEIGGAKGDLAICEEVQNEDLKDRCFGTSANVNKDATICDMIKGNKDYCYEAVGKQTFDLSTCDKIEFALGKERCYIASAVGTGDTSICENKKGIPSDFKMSYCYKNVAVALDDNSICDLNQDKSKKNSCYDSVKRENHPSFLQCIF